MARSDDRPYLLACVATAMIVAFALSAEAATFTVDTTDDLPDINAGNGKCSTAFIFGKCSLRAAIMEANRNTSGARHTVRIPAGTYTLDRDEQPGASGEEFGALNIFSGMIIAGDGGNAVIRGKSGWADRIFNIANAVNVSMSHLDIGNGRPADGRSGGAIRIASFSAFVTLTNVIVRDSSAPDAGGGGISSNGTLVLDGCAVRNNSAETAGGGIESFGSAGRREYRVQWEHC